MSLAVLDVMDNYESFWSGLKRFAPMVTELDGLVADVLEKSGLQGTRRTGLAQGKNRKQVVMIELVSTLAGDLHNIAVTDGDADLEGKTNLYKSDFLGMGDAEVGPACREIVKLAKAHAAELDELGTTAEDIAEAEAAIEAYVPLVASPRVATTQRKTITEDIATLLGKIDELYEKRLDRAMRKFAKKNKAFYDDYQNARLIVNLGARHEKEETAPADTTPAAPVAVPVA